MYNWGSKGGFLTISVCEWTLLEWWCNREQQNCVNIVKYWWGGSFIIIDYRATPYIDIPSLDKNKINNVLEDD